MKIVKYQISFQVSDGPIDTKDIERIIELLYDEGLEDVVVKKLTDVGS